MKKICILLNIFMGLLICCNCGAIYAQTRAQKPPLHSTIVEGKNINLDFRDIAVRDLLQILAEFAGKNIIVSDNVTGNISINLIDVSWRNALQTIVKIENLSIQENVDTVFVSSNNPQGSAQSVTSYQQSLQTTFLPVHYAKATDFAEIITKNRNFLSQEGSIIADPRTNSLMVQDQPQYLQAVHQYLKRIDIPVKQVLIEARIVYADTNFMRDLGLKFGTTVKDSSQNIGGVNMDLPAKFEAGYASFAIAKLGEGRLLDLELAALESEGRGRVVSNPKLVTANREPAYIEAGDEIPYQEKTSSGATSLVFKKAVLGLKVTPEITTTNQVNLHLQLNQDKVSTSNINGEPAIQTREIQTQVSIKSGQTVVLGGIYEESTNHVIHRIPFLSSIPILGLLFQSKQTQIEHKELLIFVTPKVV